MSWEDAINAARNDQGYDLSQLTPEQAASLFESRIDSAKLDKLMEDLAAATSANQARAVKLQNVLSILGTVVQIGRIAIV
jgi:hypothetical protein